MILGRLLKNEREALGKTRKEVVDKLQITEPYLFAIEKGTKHPRVSRNEDGHLDITGSLYYTILTDGLEISPGEAEGLILDALIQELGPVHSALRLLLRDELAGNLSEADRRAVLALYEGLKTIDKKDRP